MTITISAHKVNVSKVSGIGPFLFIEMNSPHGNV